jgi:hypothetical protein
VRAGALAATAADSGIGLALLSRLVAPLFVHDPPGPGLVPEEAP